MQLQAGRVRIRLGTSGGRSKPSTEALLVQLNKTIEQGRSGGESLEASFYLEMKRNLLRRFIKRVHRLALSPVLYFLKVGESDADPQSVVLYAGDQIIADWLSKSFKVISIRLAHFFAHRRTLVIADASRPSFAYGGRAMNISGSRAMRAVGHAGAVFEDDRM